MGVDRWLLERVNDAVRQHPLALDALRAITTLGRPQLLSVVSVVGAAALVARRRPRAAAFVAVATIGAWLVDNLLKHLIGRERPHLAHAVASASGPGFPSGHAMTATAAYGALLVVVLPLVPAARRWLLIGATVTLVVLIGLTRVALGVHWPTDVLGGFACGAAWLGICAAALRPTV